MDKPNQILLEELRVFPAQRWFWIGQGSGWAPAGAVALSWCLDARLSDCLEAWRQIDNLDMNSDEATYAARLIYPPLLPEPQLSETVENGKDIIGVWVLVQALTSCEHTIKIDIAHDQYQKLNSLIKNIVER